MKRVGTVFICVFVLYAGVAWAVDVCLRGDNHIADHAASSVGEPYNHEKPLINHFDSPDRPSAKLHCTDSRYQIGPVVQPSPARRFEPFTDGLQIKGPFALETVAASKAKGFWLRALFENSSLFPLQGGLPHYLFLYILRI